VTEEKLSELYGARHYRVGIEARWSNVEDGRNAGWRWFDYGASRLRSP